MPLHLSLAGVFCSIPNRRILEGVDSALILVLVVKALGIEETVGYN